MLVLGLDPGTATTGYGLVEQNEQGELRVVQCGVFLTSAGEAPEARLLVLYRQLKDFLLLHQPHGAAVEKLFFQKNITTAIGVGQARGVILLALAEAGVRVGEYTPMEVKQAVAGYGGAEKRQVQLMVKTILGMPEIPKPDDAADALAIAICHIHSDRILHLGDD